MNKKHLIENFIEYLQEYKYTEHSETNLMVWHISNHSSNDFWREISEEEKEDLINSFLESKVEM